MKKWCICLLAMVLGCSLMAAKKTIREAIQPPCNEEIKAMLDGAEIAYEIDSDGDFRLTEDVSDGRTQLLWVKSSLEVYEDVPVLEIFSYAYKGAVSPQLMEKLLKANSTLKFGSWGLAGDDPKEMMIIFYAHLPGEVSFKELAAAVLLVADAADELEQELLGTDDY